MAKIIKFYNDTDIVNDLKVKDIDRVEAGSIVVERRYIKNMLLVNGTINMSWTLNGRYMFQAIPLEDFKFISVNEFEEDQPETVYVGEVSKEPLAAPLGDDDLLKFIKSLPDTTVQLVAPMMKSNQQQSAFITLVNKVGDLGKRVVFKEDIMPKELGYVFSIIPRNNGLEVRVSYKQDVASRRSYDFPAYLFKGGVKILGWIKW